MQTQPQRKIMHWLCLLFHSWTKWSNPASVKPEPLTRFDRCYPDVQTRHCRRCLKGQFHVPRDPGGERKP